MSKFFIKNVFFAVALLTINLNITAMGTGRASDMPDMSSTMQSLFDDSSSEWVCSICREGALRGDDIRRLCCGHTFHPQCIQELTDSLAGCHTCPTCHCADPALKRHILKVLCAAGKGGLSLLTGVLNKQDYLRQNVFLRQLNELNQEASDIIQRTGMLLPLEDLKHLLTEMFKSSAKLSSDLVGDLMIKLITSLMSVSTENPITLDQARVMAEPIITSLNPEALVNSNTESLRAPSFGPLFRANGFLAEADRLEEIQRQTEAFVRANPDELFNLLRCYLSEMLFHMINANIPGEHQEEHLEFILTQGRKTQELQEQTLFVVQELGIEEELKSLAEASVARVLEEEAPNE